MMFNNSVFLLGFVERAALLLAADRATCSLVQFVDPIFLDQTTAALAHWCRCHAYTSWPCVYRFPLLSSAMNLSYKPWRSRKCSKRRPCSALISPQTL